MKERRPQNQGWWAVLGSAISLIFGNGPVMQFTFGVFITPISSDLNIGRGLLSIALTVGLCATGLCVPIAGRLVDRYGPRSVTLPAIVLFGFAMMIPSFAMQPWHLIAAYSLIGIAAAGQTPLPYARLVANSFSKRRGIALGLTMAGVGLGTVVIPQYTAYLVVLQGWRHAYLLLGLSVILVATPVVYLLVREPAMAVPRASNGVLPGKTVSAALRGGTFWLMGAACFLATLCASGVIAHVVPMLIDRGVGPAEATFAIGAAGIAMIVGRIGSGLLLDRISAPFVAAGFFAVQGIGVSVLLFVATTKGALIGAFMVGLGLGAEVDLIAFMLARYFGMRSYGTLYGLLFGIFMLAGGVGPLLMGWAFVATGSYVTALVGFEGMLTAAIVLVLCLRVTEANHLRARAPDLLNAQTTGI